MENSKFSYFKFGSWAHIMFADSIDHSLAMAEMKILLRTVYSQCRTTISTDMKGDMSMADQIISSRPKGQTCLLAFERFQD